MSQLDGFFSLRTPRELLEKLEHDFERLRSAGATTQAAQYAAFDFFVSAEHLPDWVKAASSGTLSQNRSYADGALVSHVANGAKHFCVDANRHVEARETMVVPEAFQANAFQNDAFQTGQLVIEMEDGAVVAVLDVARRVLSHWQVALNAPDH